MKKVFTYEIVEHIAVLGKHGSTTKELNLISFEGGTPKYDLRAWYRKGDEVRMLKGIALTPEEASVLKDALVQNLIAPEKPT